MSVMTENNNGWHRNANFKQHNHADWRQSVDKLLAGADFDTLVSNTFDGIKIQPLYQQDANAPFIGRSKEPWSVLQSYTSGSTEEANQRILSDLAGGVNSVELKFALSNDQAGLICNNAVELEQLLTDVQPEMIRLSLTPGSNNRLGGALLLAYYYRHKIAPQNVSCCLLYTSDAADE